HCEWHCARNRTPFLFFTCHCPAGSGGHAMSIRLIPISLTINGKKIGPVQVPESLMMIDFLHEYANLTGTKLGCGQGVCRACEVILDKEDGSSSTMRTCITGVGYFAGRQIRTVEGHAKESAEGAAQMSSVQQ